MLIKASLGIEADIGPPSTSEYFDSRAADSGPKSHYYYNDTALESLPKTLWFVVDEGWEDMRVKIDDRQLYHILFLTPNTTRGKLMLIDFHSVCGSVGQQLDLRTRCSC